MKITKICTKCKIEKPKSEFYKNKSHNDGLQSNCKICCENANKEWKKTTHGKISKRNCHLKYQYGISIEDYNDMLRNQDGRCAICGTDKPGGNFTSFHIDHKHETGKIRGLLCMSCNRLLGLYEMGKNIDKWANKYRASIISYLL